MIGSVWMELIREKPDPEEEWLVIAMVKDSPKKQIHSAASDDDVRIMQESFDSVTRVTSAIRKVDG